MNNMKDYKYVVCNEDVKLAADIIRVIILRHMQFEKEKEENKCL